MDLDALDFELAKLDRNTCRFRGVIIGTEISQEAKPVIFKTGGMEVLEMRPPNASVCLKLPTGRTIERLPVPLEWGFGRDDEIEVTLRRLRR